MARELVPWIFAGAAPLIVALGVWQLAVAARHRRERANWLPIEAVIVRTIAETRRRADGDRSAQHRPVFEYTAPDGSVRFHESSVSRSPGPRVGRRCPARLDPADYDRIDVRGWGPSAASTIVGSIALVLGVAVGALAWLLLRSLPLA